jgi:hypothetical protein
MKAIAQGTGHLSGRLLLRQSCVCDALEVSPASRDMTEGKETLRVNIPVLLSTDLKFEKILTDV